MGVLFTATKGPPHDLSDLGSGHFDHTRSRNRADRGDLDLREIHLPQGKEGQPMKHPTTTTALRAIRPELNRLPKAEHMSIRGKRLMMIALIAIPALWVGHHIGAVMGLWPYNVPLLVLFLVLVVPYAAQLVLASLEKPYQRIEGARTTNYEVTVVTPVYNEDRAILRQNLMALLEQTQLPKRVIVVNDGSSIMIPTANGELMKQPEHYEEVQSELARLFRHKGIEFIWLEHTVNQGKREAQVTGFNELLRLIPPGEVWRNIIVTTDSDSVLDYQAIEQGIIPFDNPKVWSVGGINLGYNASRNFLTRLSDLLHIQWQLNARSAQNIFHRITVNSGRLAFYRSELCFETREAYLKETFLGRPIHYSDDSWLTMQALSRGLAVQQVTSVCFTWHPETMSFLYRQRLRWMKGWFVRSFWRFKYLPVTTYAYWSEVLDLFRFILGTLVLLLVFVIRPLQGVPLSWELLVVPVVMSYLFSMRYFTVRQADIPRRQQVYTFLLAPVITVWCWFILRPIRFIAIASVLLVKKQSWSTRGSVEVNDSATTQLTPA